MDPYEEVAQQGHVHPLSPTYVLNLMKLDEHVPVYVLEPKHPEYHAPSDDDIQVEDDDEDPEEDPSEEHEPEDDDEDTEEDPNEDHEPEDEDTKEPFEDSDETESFKRTRLLSHHHLDTMEQGYIPGHDTHAISRVADILEDVGYRTAYKTELQEVHQDYVSSEDRIRALLARLKTLETHVSRMKWQRQSAEDLAVTQMIRIYALKAKARTDTVEDASSSCDPNREVPVNKTFHVQTDDEITEKELKHIIADDQAIQTILISLLEDIYAAVDSCETALEIWLRVQQMMKGSDIRIQEKKAKLCNEWERFTSTDRESIESYYHRFLKLMNDFKRNKHFLEKLANDLRAERLAKTQDPLALMATSNNPYTFLVLHQHQPSPSTYMQQPLPNNNIILQPSFNQNYMQQPMLNPEDITYLTTTINMELALMDKAFKLNYSKPTNNNQRISLNPRNRQIAQPGMKMGQDRPMQMVGGNGGNQFRQYNVGNQNGLIVVSEIANQNLNKNGNLIAARAGGNATRHNGNHIRCYNCRGLGHFARNYTVRPRRRDVAYLQTQLLIAQKEEAGIQLQAKEFDLMAVAADLDEIKEVNANCILMANLQQASTSDGSVELHNNDNFYDNEIFNMFTQEEQYTELLEPIPEPHQVLQNVNNVIFEVSSVEQSGGTVEQHPANVEETRVLYDLLYNNLAIKVEKVNTINSKLRETNAELTTELVKSTIVTLQRVVKHRMTLDTHNWSSSAHQERHKFVKDENFPIVNQVDARVQNFEKQFLKEAAKFVRDFKSLEKEANESLAKHKALELEIERLLREIVSQHITSIVQNNSIVDSSNLQTELDCTKEKLKNCIIKKEKEYAILWNKWYTKCEECKYDKILDDKAYNDMQQKIERLQAQLGDLKGKSKDTSCVSYTLNPLSQKLDNENVELETKLYVVTPIPKSTVFPKVGEKHVLSKPVTSNLVPIPTESTVVNNERVIAPGIFRINLFKASRVDNFMPNKHVKASVRTKPITVSQPHVITKNDVNSKTNGFSPEDAKITTKTRRPLTRNNPKNDKALSKSKSSRLSNNLEKIEENHRNLLSFSNQRHMSSECNNIKLDIWNAKFEVVCAMCKQCLITIHDVCLLNYVNVSNIVNQKKHKAQVWKPKNVGSKERLAYLSLVHLDLTLGGHQLEDFLTLKEK
nr:hypothetical protein [Tanacetum cinerariifolium]